MIPATQESVQPIVEALSAYSLKCSMVGDLRRGLDNPSERGDILCCPHPEMLPELGAYVNAALGQVSKGRVGPDGELSHPFPTGFMKTRGRMKLCIWFVQPEQFGLAEFMLTGPEYFVERAMKHWNEISGGIHSFGRLMDKDGNMMDTTTEDKVFELLRCHYIRPERRK